MTNKAHITESSQEWRWVGGSSLILLSIGFGLSLVTRLTLGSLDFTTILLALSVAVWSYVLGFLGLGLLSLWWIVKEVCERATPTPAETTTYRTEKTEMGTVLQSDPIPIDSGRSSNVINSRVEAHGPLKAA